MKPHSLLRRLAKPLLAAWAAAMLTLIATQPARSEADPEKVLGGVALIDWGLTNCQFTTLDRYQLDILQTIAAATSLRYDPRDVLTAQLKLSRSIQEGFSGDVVLACAAVETALLSTIDQLN